MNPKGGKYLTDEEHLQSMVQAGWNTEQLKMVPVGLHPWLRCPQESLFPQLLPRWENQNKINCNYDFFSFSEQGLIF